MLNVVKYSIIDLAPWLENRLYHYLKLVPEEDEGNEDDWEREEEPFCSLKHLEKYGLSFTSYMLLPPICVDTLSVSENLNLYVRLQYFAGVFVVRADRCDHHANGPQPFGISRRYSRLCQGDMARRRLEGAFPLHFFLLPSWLTARWWLQGLYRGFWANLLSEQELLFI